MPESEEEFSPTNSMTEELMRWLLLSGDRLVISVALTLVFFVVFLVAGLTGLITGSIPNRAMWFFNGVINGLLTLIPVAIGINQIVISQELSSLDELYDRTRNTADFRQRVSEIVGQPVTPPEASNFFHDLISSINDEGTELQQMSHDTADEHVRDEIEAFTAALTEETDEVTSLFDDIGLDIFDTLLVLLDYHNSRQFHTARYLKNEYDDALSEQTTETLGELEELFVILDSTREYIKTLWIQRELSELSRMLLYTGVPAILVAGLVIFGYRDVPGIDLSGPLVIVIVSTTVAISLLPLAVLLAYIGRVALVVQRTAAFGPFIPEAEQRRIEQTETSVRAPDD